MFKECNTQSVEEQISVLSCLEILNVSPDVPLQEFARRHGIIDVKISLFLTEHLPMLNCVSSN